MKVEQLQIPKKEAQKEYEAYVEALRQKRFESLEYLKQLKSVYAHLQHGRKIIDVFQAFKKAGVNQDGDPLLAICRADSRFVHFKKDPNGSGIFFADGQKSWKLYVDDVKLPELTYPEWPKENWRPTWAKDGEIYTRVKNERLQAPLPIIPALLLPHGSLELYYILWEVEKWKPEPPKDPMLLRRLSRHLFVVMATWNLTEIERSVIRGNLT